MPADRGQLSVHIEKESKCRTHRGAFAKLATMVDGRPRIDEAPPIRVTIGDDEQDALTDQFLAGYRMTLQEDRRHLFDRFTPVDLVRQVVGVGSVGAGSDAPAPLIADVLTGPAVLSGCHSGSRSPLDPSSSARSPRSAAARSGS